MVRRLIILLSFVKSPEFAQRLREWGWANLGGARTPKAVADYMKTERERWRRIVRELGIAQR